MSLSKVVFLKKYLAAATLNKFETGLLRLAAKFCLLDSTLVIQGRLWHNQVLWVCGDPVADSYMYISDV